MTPPDPAGMTLRSNHFSLGIDTTKALWALAWNPPGGVRDSTERSNVISRSSRSLGRGGWVAVTSQRGGYQEVVKPVVVIPVLVEAFGRALPAVVGALGLRAPRREVVQQRPRPYMRLDRLV